MKKILCSGLMIVAALVFVFQGISFAEEGTLASAGSEAVAGGVTDTTGIPAEKAASDKKDELKKEAEEAVPAAISEDGIPASAGDVKH